MKSSPSKTSLAQSRSVLALPDQQRPVLVETARFSTTLTLERYRFPNGLQLLALADHAAPVVAYHSWLAVGSRHEQQGKTGLAHLFEHLMFGATLRLGPGEYDRKMEEAGAETNASTWLDFTQYSVNCPARALKMVIELEAERFFHLRLDEERLTTERGVVLNERRFRVDDELEGAESELLMKTAFTEHAYRAPTIGWEEDIRGLTLEDCQRFYRSYYVPNNLTLVVVGDFRTNELLCSVARAYGEFPAVELPVEDVRPEPPQLSVRTAVLEKPSAVDKLVLAWHGPSLGDAEHAAVTLLAELLCGSRPTRLVMPLVHELELCSDVRMSVGPFRDPGLIELSLSAREHRTVDESRPIVMAELERLRSVPPEPEELERALAHLELQLYGSLETAEGRASTFGFYDTVTARPLLALERLQLMRRLNGSDLLRAARRFLDPARCTEIRVRKNPAPEGGAS